jgi:signal transduction histidine kinase
VNLLARLTAGPVNVLARLTARLPRPLDPIRSIKLKLGLLVCVSGIIGLSYFWLNIRRIPPVTSIIAIGLALASTYVLAHGMTRPLRDMTAAARAMARGDYSRRTRATSRDEVGELASAFNQMSADLAAADQHRRELIANVSHELRTPITALHAVLENIVDGVADPDEATLRTALAQTERLSRIVAELLDLSRIDAGAHRLELTRFAGSAFLDEVLAEAKVHAVGSGRHVQFAGTVHPDEMTVVGDRDRLKQVALNLLDNAARHSPAGGTVRIAALSEVDNLLLEVSDEGPGIPVEERDRVFERFTRGERATGGGTGLGLAIARWVVHLHGGAIAIHDARDAAGTRRGCLVRVTIPAT